MRLLFAPIALALLVCSSVHADPKSPATSEVRATGAFSGISISAAVDVELAIGDSTRVELRGPAVWLGRLTTTVKDGVLVMAMPGKWNNVPRIRAVITTPALASIAVSGLSVFKATDLAGKRLALDLSGECSLELSGSVDVVDVDLSGSAEIRAKALAARTIALDISGRGDLTIRASKQLDVSISGFADVKVYGKPPKVNETITGAGSVELVK